MKPLKIEGNQETPRIIMDIAQKKFEMSGKSFPEDALAFYKPVNKWLEEYIKNPIEKTIFDLKMDYISTASSKAILGILDKFAKLAKAGHNVLIRWHYPSDDEDIQEAGEEYEELVKVKFEHKRYRAYR